MTRPCLMLSLILCTVAAANAGPVGWRTDGAGSYAVGNPPVEWAADRNVLWSTPLPSWSNASPILLGDRLFATSEPDTLLCVSATDGALLWQHPNSLEGIATPEEVTEMRAANARAVQLRQQVGQAGGQVRRLKQDLQDKPDDAELKAKLTEAEQSQQALQAELAAHNAKWYALPDSHPTNGYSSPTPTSDGLRVYTWFTTGLVVAYDLYGTRLWQRLVAKSPISWGPSASPVLAGGYLLIHSGDLYALDLATGETRWQTAVPEGYGTGAVAKIGGTEVLITPSGSAVRIADGAVLASGLASVTYSSPLLAGDVVYFIENGGKAIRLRGLTADGKLDSEVLWTTRPKEERYYASPILHEGLIYCCMQYGVFSCLDAATGEVVYEQDLRLGKGTVYASVTLANGNLYVSSDNGTTVVVRPGRQFAEIARNTLKPFRGSPVFSGDRLYVRAMDAMYCIGQ